MSKEAMKLALEALDHNLLFTSLMPGYDGRVIEKAYKAINKVLAEQQTDWEAVAADQAMTIALLKAEQPAQRKPLTEEEIEQLASKHLDVGDGSYATHFVTGDVAFARAIEAAHGIKENT